jgi:predicted RNA binding protein YcfA (HicA-like mRNA interferase family)
MSDKESLDTSRSLSEKDAPKGAKIFFGESNIAAIIELINTPELIELDELLESNAITQAELEEYLILTNEYHEIRAKLFILINSLFVHMSDARMDYYLDKGINKNLTLSADKGAAQILASLKELEDFLNQSTRSVSQKIVCELIANFQQLVLLMVSKRLHDKYMDIAKRNGYLDSNFQQKFSQTLDEFFRAIRDHLSRGIWEEFELKDFFTQFENLANKSLDVDEFFLGDITSVFDHESGERIVPDTEDLKEEYAKYLAGFSDEFMYRLDATRQMSHFRRVPLSRKKSGLVYEIMGINSEYDQNNIERSRTMCYFKIYTDPDLDMGSLPESATPYNPKNYGDADGAIVLALDRSTGFLVIPGLKLNAAALFHGKTYAELANIALEMLFDALIDKAEDIVPASRQADEDRYQQYLVEQARLEEQIAHQEISAAVPEVVKSSAETTTKLDKTALKISNFRLLSNISGSDVLRAATSLMGNPVRINGSHHFFKGPSGRTYPVPIHKGKSVGAGLLDSCLSVWGLDVGEFLKSL